MQLEGKLARSDKYSLRGISAVILLAFCIHFARERECECDVMTIINIIYQ